MSSAPGPAGIESAWAISTRRQSLRPSATPITLRERPRGVGKRWTRTSSPAARKRSATRRWARASAAEAAGRGPAFAVATANEYAASPGAASASTAAASASTVA